MYSIQLMQYVPLPNIASSAFHCTKTFLPTELYLGRQEWKTIQILEIATEAEHIWKGWPPMAPTEQSRDSESPDFCHGNSWKSLLFVKTPNMLPFYGLIAKCSLLFFFWSI